MSRSLRFLLPAAALVCAATAVRAEEAPAAAAATLPPYILKNRSLFSTVTDDQRAPFWPIGWAKRKPNAVASATAAQHVEVPKTVLDAKNYKVTSILLGNPSLAIINGRTYSEGESLRTPRTREAIALGAAAPAAARIRVYRINDGSIALQCEDQIITVGLSRPELIQRRAGEDLLLEDRP